MKTCLSRICLVALFALAVACSGKEKQKGVDDAAATSATVAERADSAPESMPDLMREIEEQQAKVPRDRVDPAAIVAASRDPEKILLWVRDNTRLVPYEGSLRGPLGVLMDRSGNSLDRSLLLARLFDLAGFETRVVGNRLSSAEAAKILAASPNTQPVRSDDEQGQGGLRKQANAIAALIMDNVGSLTAVTQAPEATHYWVQFKEGKQWVDADPTLAGVGKVQPGSKGTPMAIDPATHGVARPAEGSSATDLAHSVTMKLVVERWEAGKLVENLLAVVPFNPSGGPLAAMTVTFAPVDGSTGRAVQPAFTSGAELSEKMLDETAWAVIFADETGRGRIGRKFDDAGVIGDIPSFDAVGQLNRAGGQAFGALTGGLSGEESAEDEAESTPTVLTALIADYEFHSPGKPSMLIRRFIFDSIGPEARRASGSALPRPKWTDQQVIERGADLAAINDTLVAFASLPWETYVYRYGQRVIDAKDAILAVAAGSKDEATRRRVSYALGFRTLELFAAERHSTIAPEMVIAEPQVYRRIIRFMPTAEVSALDVQVFADLAWNRLAPATGKTNAMTVIEQGVLDTLQEREIVLSREPLKAGQSTAALLDEAARQGIKIAAVRVSTDVHLAGIPGAARARMLVDIEAGQIVVAPLQTVNVAGRARLGWWRVDPDSGQTIGAMDNGLLSATTEYSVTQEAEEARIHGYTTEERARAWANEVARRRGGEVSDTQYQNLMRLAAKSIEEFSVVPSI